MAFRLMLFLVMMALVIAFGAAAPTPPPWPLLIGFFFIFGLVVVTLSIVTDRRLAVRSGRASAPWTGSNARWVQFAYPVPLQRAIALAATALSQMGAQRVETVNDVMVTGWVGSALTNLPQWQQYQLAVGLAAAPDGTTVFTSCARPRSSMAYMGASKSQQLATALQNELWILVQQD